MFKSSRWTSEARSRKRDSLIHSTYAPPSWLPGGNLQTIYARRLARRYPVQYRRERWAAPDGDFIDLDWTRAVATDSKVLVLFHGLEGCSRSHYAMSFMTMAQQRGWRGVVPHFRGCGGESNKLPRAYHSGDAAEIDWILRRLKRENPECEIYVVGVSLGGNMLLKWLGEQANRAPAIVKGAVAVSAPVDLHAAAALLDSGYRRAIYTRRFLRSLKGKVLAKIAQHGLDIDPAAMHACSTFRQFDDIYTAPMHGFKDADDYWTRASSKPWLKNICVRTLMINAQNDPFLPASALPCDDEVSGSVTLDFPNFGGHVGFVSGSFPGSLDWLSRRIFQFFTA